MTYTTQPKPERTRAVAYLRVSTDKQELSPEAQREVVARWARENDIKIVSWHQDVLSGSTPWAEREGLTAAVDMVKRHQASWLVVAKTDRLSRDLYNQLHLGRELQKYDARFIAATESPDDELTPEKQLMQNMLGSFAEFERQMIRGRIKAALAVRKSQGVRLGSTPLEATELGRCIIWAMWHLHDQGYGCEKIAKILNEKGVRGPKGGRQHERNVQRILRMPRPSELPRAWIGGIDLTFRRFRDVDGPGSQDSDGNHTDAGAAKRRGRTKGQRVAKDAADAAEKLTWGREHPEIQQEREAESQGE